MSHTFKRSLIKININAATLSSGGFAIFEGLQPIYLGFTPYGVRERLYAHFQGNGNAKVAAAVKTGRPLEFFVVETLSARQAKSELKQCMSPADFNKLKLETDPTDRLS